MIVIKTRLRTIPATCCLCPYYLRASKTYFGAPACGAADGLEDGKPLYVSNRQKSKFIQPTKERPKWCPLVKIAKSEVSA